MRTCLILLSLATSSDKVKPRFEGINQKDKITYEGKLVIMLVDIRHFYDADINCTYGICICREARLVSDTVHEPPVSLNRKNLQCSGIVNGETLILILPAGLEKFSEGMLTVQDPVNVINYEREIVFSIRPGDYSLQECAPYLHAVVGLLME